MESLRSYLNSLKPQEQVAFAARCGTTIGYLRKAISKGQNLGAGMVVEMERISRGKIRCEDVRPDVDWSYLRESCKH